MMSQRTVILHHDVCVPLPETTTLLLRFCLLPNLWKATASVSGQGAKTKCFCLPVLVFEKEGEEKEEEVFVKGVINMPFYTYLWGFWLIINVRPLDWSLSLKKKRPGNGHNMGPLSLSFSHSIRVHVAKITPGNFTKDYIFCTSSFKQAQQTSTFLLSLATSLTNLFLHAQLFMDCIKYALGFARAAHVSFWVSLGGTCLLLQCLSGLNFPNHMHTCTRAHSWIQDTLQRGIQEVKVTTPF